MTLLTALAPAKINLGLAIVGSRADDYHELRSVLVRLAFADRLEVETVSESNGVDTLAVRGDPRCSPTDNLVLRAAALLRDEVPRDLPPLRFSLDKQIPMGAGLGGGSSDAAVALSLAAQAWALELPASRHADLAGRLGADVSFFTAGAPIALVSGVGETLEALPGLGGALGVLIAVPAVEGSTRAVFEAYDAGTTRRTHAASIVDSLAEAFRQGCTARDVADSAEVLRDANDLWDAACDVAPELPALRADLEARLGRPVLLTGSGSSLVALYPSPRLAADACRSLAAHAVPSLAMTAMIVTCDD